MNCISKSHSSFRSILYNKLPANRPAQDQNSYSLLWIQNTSQKVNLLIIFVSNSGKVTELRSQLATESKRTSVLKRIVANMTMGNDMAPLYPDVLACMQNASLAVKKLVYLYIIFYARAKLDHLPVLITNVEKVLSKAFKFSKRLSIILFVH